MAMHCYINIPLSLTNYLRRVQNCAARLVTHTHKREHKTPVLFQLHWLPVRVRSLNKILFHKVNVWSGTAALYLSDLIEKYIPLRMLRSECHSLLRVQKSHTGMYGDKSFQASALRLSDKLPNHIKLAGSKEIFCKVLKTIYLNWRIYNFKPVYYVWNVFELSEIRICFN